MKIDFLELTNFRNIHKQKIEFSNKNFVVLIGDNGSGKTTILEAITKAFVPVLRAVNSESVKKCDLTNNDIQYGSAGTAITIGISLESEQYVWMNRRRFSTQVPNGNAIEQKGQIQNDLKSLKVKYAECVEKKKLPLA